MNNLTIPSTILMHCAFIKEKFSYLWGKEKMLKTHRLCLRNLNQNDLDTLFKY